MTEMVLLRDLSVVMVAAAATTMVCQYFKQPVVIGYLLAGLLIGPHTPPFALVKDLHSIHTMAELGLVFLLFAVGLEFNLPKLKRVGPSAAIAAVLEVIGMFAIGYEVGRLFGWGVYDRLVLGAILSISSTTIIIKVFMDLKQTREDFAQLVLGILILEDIVAVIILTLLSGLGASASQEAAGLAVLASLWKVSLFTVLFLIIGLATVPPLIQRIARMESPETLGITTLGLCLAGALLANVAGFSVALGAFLIGSIIGVSRDSNRVEEWIHPVRDMFSAIFFVAAGMLLDMRVLIEHWNWILILTGVTVVGKIVTGTAGAFLAGYPMNTSLKAGVSLGQIGEFSFVFATLAIASGKASHFLYPLAVSVSVLTTVLTPFLIRRSDTISGWIMAKLPVPVTSRLNRYHQWVSRPRLTADTVYTIYSRYLFRLGIYAALLIGVLVGLRRMVELLPLYTSAIWLWVASYLAIIPLILAVAYYLNHFFLLGFTEVLARGRGAKLLAIIPIHHAYKAFESLVVGGLTVLFFAPTFNALPQRTDLWLFVGAGLAAFMFKKLYRRAYLAMEDFLDQLLGRASSEPLRPAALSKESTEELLGESMEKILLIKGAPSIGQTIRELAFREKTGANLIGIYRQGTLKTSPGPETILKENDLLVVLGDPAERRRANRLLCD